MSNTKVDEVLHRSNSMLAASGTLSLEERRKLTENVLERDGYRCQECGQEGSECNLVIVFKKQPSEFTQGQEAYEMDNLVTKCEDDKLSTDMVAAETTSSGTISDGFLSSFSSLEGFFLSYTPSKLLVQKWYWFLLGGILLYFIGFLLSPILVPIANFALAYPVLTLPFLAVVFTTFYLLERYSKDFKPFHCSPITHVPVMLLGSLATAMCLFGFADAAGATNVLFTQEGGSVGVGFWALIIQPLAMVAMVRLVRHDKTELVERGLILLSEQYDGSLERRLEKASEEEFVPGEDFESIKWRTVIFTTTMVSVSTLYFWVPVATGVINQLLLTVVILLPAAVLLAYLYIRRKWYTRIEPARTIRAEE